MGVAFLTNLDYIDDPKRIIPIGPWEPSVVHKQFDFQNVTKHVHTDFHIDLQNVWSVTKQFHTRHNCD